VRRGTISITLLLGCAPKSSDGTASTGPTVRCSSSVEMQFPSGSWAAFEGCNDVLADATFEFDPDDPPEIRSFKIQLSGSRDSDFDCWLVMTSRGLCGPGFYGVGEGQSTTVEFETLDCGYVPDDWEGSYVATDGLLRLETVSSGDVPGNYAGRPLFTEFIGSLEASTADGTEVILTFDIGLHLVGEDAEEAECLQAD
jgi:hypothetical protein